MLKHVSTGELRQSLGWVRRVGIAARNVKAWAGALEWYLNNCGKGRWSHRLVMVTLTYHYGEDWRPLAISGYISKCRKHMRDQLLAYTWVAESQLRGAIHYHVLLLVKRGTDIPMPDSGGFWNEGSTRIETAHSPYYILTYTGKAYQKQGSLPKGARVTNGWIRPGLLRDDEMLVYREQKTPRWVLGCDCELRAKGLITGSRVITRTGGRWYVNGVPVESGWVALTPTALRVLHVDGAIPRDTYLEFLRGSLDDNRVWITPEVQAGIARGDLKLWDTRKHGGRRSEAGNLSPGLLATISGVEMWRRGARESTASNGGRGHPNREV